MVIRLYRRVETRANINGPQLGYLEYDRGSHIATRYTPAGDLIDANRWQQDFDAWFHQYQEAWSLNPSDAYFPLPDADLHVDEGL